MTINELVVFVDIGQDFVAPTAVVSPKDVVVAIHPPVVVIDLTLAVMVLVPDCTIVDDRPHLVQLLLPDLVRDLLHVKGISMAYAILLMQKICLRFDAFLFQQTTCSGVSTPE